MLPVEDLYDLHSLGGKLSRALGPELPPNLIFLIELPPSRFLKIQEEIKSAHSIVDPIPLDVVQFTYYVQGIQFIVKPKKP
jgi:hypothetical protein